ncbi:phosphate-binding protein [Nitrospira sp.]|nr:phosphate-binding protein [Nitrospira sp.]
MATMPRYFTTVVLGLTFASVGTFSSDSLAERANHTEKPSTAPIGDFQPNPKLEGRLSIGGSDTMQPLLRKLASDFTLRHPKIIISVEGTGSSAGIREFLMGISLQRRGDKARSKGHAGATQVQALASSRELTDKEISNFVSRYGYEPTPIAIAMDAIAIYVHKDNPVENLSLEQLAGIFGDGATSQNIEKWGQAGVQIMANEPINLYGRNSGSGTYDIFIDAVLRGGSFKPSITETPGSASEVLSIGQDPLAIGYAGVGFKTSDVRVVPLRDAAGTAQTPGLETVTTERYPLSRTLWLYANQDPKSAWDPELLEFLKYVNSPRGQAIVSASHLYPLPESVVAKNHSRLNGTSMAAAASRP